MREAIKKILRESTDLRKIFPAIKKFFEGREIEAMVWDYSPVQVHIQEVHRTFVDGGRLLFLITVENEDGWLKGDICLGVETVILKMLDDYFSFPWPPIVRYYGHRKSSYEHLILKESVNKEEKIRAYCEKRFRKKLEYIKKDGIYHLELQSVRIGAGAFGPIIGVRFKVPYPMMLSWPVEELKKLGEDLKDYLSLSDVAMVFTDPEGNSNNLFI